MENYNFSLGTGAENQNGRVLHLVWALYYPARALRALGLLLADGTPTVGGGKTF